MVVGKNKTGSGKYVLSYRCDNKSCDRSPKSLRAFKIFDSIYVILDTMLPNDKAYDRYKAELDNLTDDMIIKIKQDVHSKRVMASQLSKELGDRMLQAGRTKEKTTAYKINAAKMDNLSVQVSNLEFEIQKLEERIANPDKIRLSKDEFLNLVKTAPDKMRAGSAVEKDQLCRILFLNLHVDNEKAANYLWREPFATMVKMGELQAGGDVLGLFETRPLEDILADIAEGWNSTKHSLARLRVNTTQEAVYVL